MHNEGMARFLFLVRGREPKQEENGMHRIFTRGVILPAVAVALFAGVAFGEDGVTDKEVVLGQSCALEGPAKELGRGMRAGLQACFAKVNAAGGINGRTIRLISKDDGYEPDKAIKNTRALIEEDKVFLLIGEVGTPTSQAVVPIAEESKVPFFGPFTGAEFLRNPFKKYVINIRASYYQEMEALAGYLVDQKKLKSISCFYQNDGYGQAGLKGIEIALAKRNMKLASTGTYERNTTAVKSGLLQIRKSKPEAVVMVGAYAPCAEFIKLAKTVGLQDAVFCNISFVGSQPLCDALGEAGEGCLISQVVPYPEDASVPFVKEYKEAMDARKETDEDAKVGFRSLEGFTAGRVFCEVLKAMQGQITREAFIEKLQEIGTFDLGGVKLTFGPEDHQGMDKVFLTVIKGGKVVPLE